VIAAGGTAGHVVPALAVAEALRAEDAEVVFVGARRAEAQLVPAAGFTLHPIAVEGLSRSNPLHALRALALALAAVPRARALLRQLAPDAVMGGGGYVAGPVGVAALTLRIPLVITEADSHLGLTNRLLAPFTRRVCLAFPLAGRSGPRYRVTGRPVPTGGADRSVARERLSLGLDDTCVLVFGGSLGARSINLAAFEAFADVPFHVLHVCGRREYRELSQREHPPAYDLREYLDVADFTDALAAADLVVARAGGSVFELAAHGLPAVLVPYPHAAGGHQLENARWMSEGGAAVTIPDAELTGARLRSETLALLADRPRLQAMASASRGLSRPMAAVEVASELLRAAA
jgi:UDP-N-acetylglucosamine--N-acetylmuramyl-(pentapeptide) pyrophosphoryl-undecaprenol N-acetylglucosamine transferase